MYNFRYLFFVKAMKKLRIGVIDSLNLILELKILSSFRTIPLEVYIENNDSFSKNAHTPK